MPIICRTCNVRFVLHLGAEMKRHKKLREKLIVAIAPHLVKVYGDWLVAPGAGELDAVMRIREQVRWIADEIICGIEQDREDGF